MYKLYYILLPETVGYITVNYGVLILAKYLTNEQFPVLTQVYCFSVFYFITALFSVWFIKTIIMSLRD